MPKTDELEELLRISPRLAAIIDSEREAAGAPLRKDRAGFLELCAAKHIPSMSLSLRAIENYFSDAVVKTVFGSAYRGLEPYEKLNSARPHWSKAENWKLAAQMGTDELANTDIGQFLRNL